MKPLYQVIASTYHAWVNCEKSGNSEWYGRHQETIDYLCKTYLPSGSGFDCGTTLDMVKSAPEKLVFISSFHHKDEMGGYDQWSELKIVVTPSLQFGVRMRITGIARKYQINEDFFQGTFDYALTQEVEQ